MSQIKFIFTGPPGAGKTTAIATISEFPPVSTDVFATDSVASMKDKTTVAMDFGEITLENGQKIRLYGTPGQKRFDFMWKILVQGGLGLLILINNDLPDPLAELEQYLTDFDEFIKETDVVIGVTRMDISPSPSLDDYYNFLREREQMCPVFAIDARSEPDVLLLLDALLACLENV